MGAAPAAHSVAEAEAALVRHYRRLVRLAYLALPADRDRHSRVLAAHAAVQRALPLPLRRARRLDDPTGPGPAWTGTVEGGAVEAGTTRTGTARAATAATDTADTAADDATDGTDQVYAALRLRVLRAALRPRPGARQIGRAHV